MNYCNSIKSASAPAKKRGAPIISLDEFNEIISEEYNMAGFEREEVIDFFHDAKEKEGFIRRLFKTYGSCDCPNFYSQLKMIGDDSTTTAIKSVDPTNCLLGMKILDSGLPIYGFLLGGEIEKPFFSMIYWNGRRLRIYIPEYGNTINKDFYSGFGSEAYSIVKNIEMQAKQVHEYEDVLGKTMDDVVCSVCEPDIMEFMSAGMMYGMVNGYASNEDEAYEVMNTLSWDSIIEDIEDNIEEAEQDETDPLENENSTGEEDEEECYEEEEEPDGLSMEELEIEFHYLDLPEITKETDFCNNKRTQIKIGRNYLPAVEPEEFIKHLSDFYRSSGVRGRSYDENLITLAKKVMEQTDLKIDIRYATMSPELCTIESSSGPCLLGYQVMDSGVPFMGLEIGDFTCSNGLFVALFWDGKTIVPHIPSYGNTYNTDLKTLFGDEHKADEFIKRRYAKLYESRMGMEDCLIDASGQIDHVRMRECYFKSFGIEREDIKEFECRGSWNAMLESLTFAVPCSS